MTRYARILAVLLFTLSLLVGCSGDEVIGTGLDEEIVGLKLPESINVLEPKEEKPANTAMQLNAVTQAVFDDVGTDYSTDSARTTSSNSLQAIVGDTNIVLCFLNALRLDRMVNKGPYKAILTKDPCPTEYDASTVWEILTFTVTTEREDNFSPQTFKVWETIPIGGEFYQNFVVPPEFIIEGKINGNVSELLPFGDFSVLAQVFVDSAEYGGTAGELISTGFEYFRTDAGENNEPQFKSTATFDLLGLPVGDFLITNSSLVSLDTNDYQNGHAIKKEEVIDANGSSIETLVGQFDSNYLLQGKDTNEDNILESRLCSSRNQFESIVNEYNLYHEFDGTFRGLNVTAGERVNLTDTFWITISRNSPFYFL